MVTQTSPISLHIMLSLKDKINKLEQKNSLATDFLRKISALETGGSKGEIIREAKVALTKIDRL